eukprot:gene8973-1307_t
MESFIDVIQVAQDILARNKQVSSGDKLFLKITVAILASEVTEKSLHTSTQNNKIDQILSSVGHDLRKLYITTTTDPVTLEDIAAISEHCKTSCASLIDAYLPLLHNHGISLMESVHKHLNQFLRNVHELLDAFVKNNNRANKMTLAIMGKVEESLAGLAKMPKDLSQALMSKFEVCRSLLEDAATELTQEIDDYEELDDNFEPAHIHDRDEERPPNDANNPKSGYHGDDGDDGDNEDMVHNWDEQEQLLVKQTLTVIQAACKLLHHMAKLFKQADTSSLLSVEENLLEVVESLSPNVDELVLALYESDEDEYLLTAFSTIENKVMLLLDTAVTLSSSRPTLPPQEDDCSSRDVIEKARHVNVDECCQYHQCCDHAITSRMTLMREKVIEIANVCMGGGETQQQRLVLVIVSSASTGAVAK